ncbi:MAG: 3-hydroxyacyl-[acyl-carrier-protein] dehydratase [Gammaproteobacteria bacterium]|jgi:3-hydroxyacyl-[acyl-carrier-protein] dehydratase
MTVIDINQIKNYLPHRYPFLLLDKVLDCVPGETITALKNVTINEPFFHGHFPQKPLMPGVLIIEAMAQAAAILGVISGAESRDDLDDVLYYLVGIDKARFRKTVQPGDQLIIEVRFITVRRNIWKFSATASVDGKKVANTELLTTVADPES